MDFLLRACYGDDPVVRIQPDLDFGNLNPRDNEFVYGGLSYRYITQRYKIFWPEIKNAECYRLYGSISPLRKKNLLEDGISTTFTTYVPPVFTPVIEYFFWVTVLLSDGRELYLDEQPSSLQTQAMAEAFGHNPISQSQAIPDAEGLNREMAQDLGFIRDANQFELENGGEIGNLFQRRFLDDLPYGIPCECTGASTENLAPGGQARGNCDLCFATGIYGGYYPSIPIRFRYGNAPVRTYTRTRSGHQVTHGFNTAMVWAPQIRTGDLIVRKYDGARFMVSNRRESSFRAVRLHQEFDMAELPINHIRYQVTDEQIARSLNVAQMPGFVRSGFIAFG